MIEFLINTWWYASILAAIIHVFSTKMLDGEYKIKDIFNTMFSFFFGYISLILFTIFTLIMVLIDFKDKKLF